MGSRFFGKLVILVFHNLKTIIYSDSTGAEVSVGVQKVIMHEDYASGGYQDNYDLALLKTDPFQIDGSDISIACLPHSGRHLTDKSIKCYAAGWASVLDFYFQPLRLI